MPSIAAFLSFACIMSFTPGPNNIMALSSASAYGLRKGLRFCFGVLLGVLGLMTACALFGAALFRFLPDVEPTMRAVGAGVYPLDGLWRLAVGIRKRRFPPCTGQRRRFRDAAAIRQPQRHPLWDNRLLVLCASLLRFLYGFGCFHRRALGCRLCRDMFLGAFWSRIPSFPPEPPYRRQREHGAPAGVVCRFPVYLIISNGCNSLPRPWAHRVMFKDTVLCPIKRGNRTLLSTRSRYDLNFPTPYQSKVFGRGGEEPPFWRKGAPPLPNTFLYRTFPRSTASGLRSSVLANTRTARAASVISRMA